MSPKLRVGLIAFLISLPVALITKILVVEHLTYTDRVPVIEGFFYLTHVRNTGAAFGLFADGPIEVRLTFFIGVSIVAIGIIASFFRRLAPGEKLPALALGLILGGALGNLIDRIFRYEVVDFLHFRLWRGYSWPDFNFADTFIVVGVAILVLELLATEGENRSSEGGDASTA
jgi:signal peptidase II